jgi:nucleoside 2-deoxyribosyltransferase
LAGPEVFLPDASRILNQKKEMCAKNGFEGVCPFDVEADISRLPKSKAGIQIGQNNENLIRSCDIVIANLTPFRGPSADVGTAYECGFARALGLLVFGYTHTTSQFFARTVAWLKESVRKGKDEQYRDAAGMAIEDFDLSDNLMIPAGIAGSGGKVIVARAPKSKWFTELSGFELCLKTAKKVADRIPASHART